LGLPLPHFNTGNAFSVNKSAITNLADPVISRWQHPWHGLEALLNWRNIALGLAVFFLSRVLGILYFMNTIDDEQILLRSKKQLPLNAIPFLVCFLAFAFAIFTMPGFAVRPYDGTIMGESYKYFHNLIQMPIVMLMLAAGVVFVLLGVALPLLSFEKSAASGIWYAGPGTILTVFALFCLVGFNNTAYYPSVYDMQSSLTIHNSSSSYYSLTAMSYVSLLVPFVVAYIWYAWKAINSRKIDQKEMDEGGHSY
jgi:cytochrome d ubiquinol oxidase subunit II